jgi:uncharacterized membrane protein
LPNNQVILYRDAKEAVPIGVEALGFQEVERPRCNPTGRPFSIPARAALATIKFLIACSVVLAGSTAMIALGIIRMLLVVPVGIGMLCGLFSGVGWLVVYLAKDESIPHAIHWCLGSFAVAFTAIVIQAMTHIASEWIGERVGRI